MFKMKRKKIIPYNGKQKPIKTFILMHRAKVTSIIRMIIKELNARAKCHDNSMTCEAECLYTSWMANSIDDSLISDEKIKVAIQHHYHENDHHVEHFSSVAEMNIFQLTSCLADALACVSYQDVKNMVDYEKKVHEYIYGMFRRDIPESSIVASILCNTATQLIKQEKIQMGDIIKQ